MVLMFYSDSLAVKNHYCLCLQCKYTKVLQITRMPMITIILRYYTELKAFSCETWETVIEWPNWWVKEKWLRYVIKSIKQSNFLPDPYIASKHPSVLLLLLECGNATICIGLIKTSQAESACTQISPTLCNIFSQCWLRLAAVIKSFFSGEGNVWAIPL